MTGIQGVEELGLNPSHGLRQRVLFLLVPDLIQIQIERISCCVNSVSRLWREAGESIGESPQESPGVEQPAVLLEASQLLLLLELQVELHELLRPQLTEGLGRRF